MPWAGPGPACRFAAFRTVAVVLVVDDDGDLLETYAAMLAMMGHQAVTKRTLESAPETVREVAADALVVDLEARDEHHFGLRIIEEIRTAPETAQLPIILCTGATEAVRPIRDKLEALMVPVVTKPFPLEVLEGHLQAVLTADR